MRWECEEHMEIGKLRLDNCEEKIPTRAQHHWGARQGQNADRVCYTLTSSMNCSASVLPVVGSFLRG